MCGIVKNYRDTALLRHSFNELAGEVFGLDFEDWYQNGYWGENYIPYSIVKDGKVIANVSVNTIDFILNGSRKHLIQLGTVMTKESCRNRGYIRLLMQEIEKDYYDKADGIFLFANDEVLDFYPKFGFSQAAEYEYGRQFSDRKPSDGDLSGRQLLASEEPQNAMVQILMREKKDWDRLEEAVKRSVPCGAFEMTDNSGLILFHVTKFMQENVYYHEKTNAYVVAERNRESLLIHNIFSEKKPNLNEIIKAFGAGIKKISLGFTPDDEAGYSVSERKEEDTTLFVQGEIFRDFEQNRLMFPTLSHA